MKTTLFAVAAVAFVAANLSNTAQAEPWECSANYFDAAPCLDHVRAYKDFVAINGLEVSYETAEMYEQSVTPEIKVVFGGKAINDRTIGSEHDVATLDKALDRLAYSPVQEITPNAPLHPRIAAAQGSNGEANTLVEAFGRTFEWDTGRSLLARK